MEIKIFGNKYDIKGNIDENHLKNLSAYIDKKMNEVSGNTQTVSTVKVSILAALNITNELFQTKDQLNDIDVKSDNLINIINKEIESE